MRRPRFARWRLAPLMVIAVAAWWVPFADASARTVSGVEQVSLATGVQQPPNFGSNPSAGPVASRDGRVVAFESTAALVPGDTNTVADIFVRDTVAATTTRVSVSGTGVQGNGASVHPGVSADGRFVVFSSSATNLVAGDTNGFPDVFVHDRATGTTTRVSVTAAGAQAPLGGDTPAISGDGRFVVFDSLGILPEDTNAVGDVYRRDLVTGAVTIVSRTSAAGLGNSTSTAASVSDDGSVVAFYSFASNLVAGDGNGVRDIFVRDVAAGTTRRVSVTPTGADPDDWSEQPAISGDGRFVAFESTATNLVPGDTNGVVDGFVADRSTGAVVMVSVGPDGAPGDNASSRPTLSADGRFAAFTTAASNLTTGGSTGQVLLRDLQRGVTTVVSATADGTPGDPFSFYARVTADGTAVAFMSRARNLVPPASTFFGAPEVFLARTGPDTRPVAVYARAASEGAVDVAWTAPEDPAPDTVTAYDVVATDVASGLALPPVTITGAPPANQVTVPGLVAGREYAFTVTATGPAGRTAPSIRTLPVRPTGRPGLTGAPPDAVVGTSYAFPFTVNGSPAPTVVVTAGTLPPGLELTAAAEIVGTPTAAGRYPFSLQASNGVGPVAALDVTLVVTGPPEPPSAVVAVGRPGRIEVGWQPPTGDGGSPLTAYTVTVTDVATGATTSTDVTATGGFPPATSATVAGLTPEAAYVVRMVARNAIGESTAAAAAAPVVVPAIAGTVAPAVPRGSTIGKRFTLAALREIYSRNGVAGSAACIGVRPLLPAAGSATRTRWAVALGLTDYDFSGTGAGGVPAAPPEGVPTWGSCVTGGAASPAGLGSGQGDGLPGDRLGGPDGLLIAPEDGRCLSARNMMVPFDVGHWMAQGDTETDLRANSSLASVDFDSGGLTLDLAALQHPLVLGGSAAAAGGFGGRQGSLAY